MNRRHFVRRSMAGFGAAMMAGSVPHTLLGSNISAELVSRSSWAMGTSISLSAPRGMWERGVEAQPFGALARIDQLLSVHNKSSEISRLNQADSWIEAGAELREVAAMSLLLGEATNGALDVTVLPLMKAYGFLPGAEVEDLRDARRHVDFRGLSVRGSQMRIRPRSGVDFGGIAKGFGLDQAMRAAKSSGLEAGLIEAGGDLFAYGRPSPDRDWRIGIRDPENVRGLAAKVTLHDEGIATSGSYLQRRLFNGVSVGHILDPRTGAPCDHLTSATVIAPTAMEADGLATALSVMSVRAGLAMIEARPSTEGLWILPDASVRMTRGMRKRATLL